MIANVFAKHYGIELALRWSMRRTGMGAIWQDLRYALRGIAKAPFLSFAVLLALSAGIGLNAAVFALVEGVWFRAPVEKDQASFIEAIPSYSGWFDTENLFHGFTVKDYQAIHARAGSLQDVAAFSSGGGAKLDNDSAESNLWLVTCNFFSVYGWRSPIRGRLLLPSECAAPGSAPVVVITDALWRNHYATDPHVVGRIIHINQRPFTVVGVVDAHVPVWMRGDLYVPYTMQADFFGGYDGFKEHPDYPWLKVAARLKTGHSQSDAQAELRLIQSQQDRLIPGRKTTIQVTNGSMFQDPQERTLGFVIFPLVMGPMVLILLVACTNVTVLLLSRAAARQSEIAIRLTLGAARGRLLRMLATEGLIVAVIAGAISAYLAYKLPDVLWAFLLRRPDHHALRPDWVVFAYLASATLVAGCIAGLAPARLSLKVDLLRSLKWQQGTATAHSRIRNVLIITQMAISFVLVAAGVLFLRLERSVSIDPGFETRQVMAVPLEISMPPYTAESAANFHRAVQQRLHELPGVRSASYTDVVPFSQGRNEVFLPEEPQGQLPVVVERVSTDFFATLGISIVRGRAFRDSDATASGSAPVAVVSQAFAAAFWNDQDPLGKTVLLPDNTHVFVVGIARNLKSSEFDVPDGPRLYLAQNPRALTGSLMIRFDGDARSLTPLIAQIVREMDSTQVLSPRTLQSMMEVQAERIRPLTSIVIMMALLTLAMAISGIYGTVAFSMSQRTREIGIRTALGATKEHILRSVLVTGIRQVAIGLSAGVVLALPAAFAFRLLLRSSSVFDWRTYCVAALALTLAALSAYYIPARRAMRLDPIVALRYE